MTDSDIVAQRRQRGEAGDRRRSRPRAEVHEHVTQANLTDWDFLKARARRDRLRADRQRRRSSASASRSTSSDAPREGDFNASDPLQLVFGANLLAFHGRVSAAGAGQRGRGPRLGSRRRRRRSSGRRQAGTTSAKLERRPGELARHVRQAPMFVAVTGPSTTRAPVDAGGQGHRRADRERLRRGRRAWRAATRSCGPAPPCASPASSDDFGGALRPDARPPRVRSRRLPDAVHGQRPPGPLAAGPASPARRTAARRSGVGTAEIYGLVVGMVTDNDDPEKLGRVKVKFPWLAEDYSSDWAPVIQLGRRARRAARSSCRRSTTRCWSAFEHGDIDRPIVIGGLFNGKDKPRRATACSTTARSTRRGFVSRKGHRLVVATTPTTSPGSRSSPVDGKLAIALNETSGDDPRLRRQQARHRGDGDIEIKARAATSS